VRAGTRTADLGGQAFTSEFTDAVIALVRAKLAPDGLTRETERSS